MANCSLLLTTGNHLLKTDGYRLTLTAECPPPTMFATYREHTTAEYRENTTDRYREHTTATYREG